MRWDELLGDLHGEHRAEDGRVQNAVLDVLSHSAAPPANGARSPGHHWLLELVPRASL